MLRTRLTVAKTYFVRYTRLLELWLIRVPVMLFLATTTFIYEYYIVPDAEQVELSNSSPEVLAMLMGFFGFFMLYGFSERTGITRVYELVWRQIHRVAEAGRRRIPHIFTLSMLKLLHGIEEHSPTAIQLLLVSPILVPGILAWHFLLPRLKRYIWKPLFKNVVPVFWLTLNSRVYQKLEPTRPLIRLLYLDPGRYDDPISCRLIEASVQDVEFEAVSYAWGGHLVLRRSISINGQVFFVTENIIKALRHLRHTDATRILWIDQMCINQLDEIEKTDQVTQKMHLVYSNASQVIVWLGIGSPSISWAFQRAVKHPGKAFDDTMDEDLPPADSPEESLAASWLITLLTIPFWWLPSGSSSKDKEEPVHKPENPNLKCYKDVWREIFWRKWFRRIWVIQETVLAKRLLVMCGDAEISWDMLRRTVSDLRRIHRVKPNAHAQALMDFAEEHARYSGSEGLLDLAIRFRKYESTDPRDKLIGLLALAEDGRQFPDVGYNFQDRGVFANFTATYIERSKSLEIFGLAENRATTEMVPEGSVCSWALDWAAHDIGIYQPKVLWGSRLEESFIAEVASYSASGYRPTVSRREEGPPIPPLVRGLFLRGWNEDTVQAVSISGSKYDESMKSILPIWKEFVTRQLPNDTDLHDKFGRVITAELMPDRLDQPWGAWYVGQYGTQSDENRQAAEDIRQASTILESLCHGRRIFVTAKGRLGIGPPGTSVGDEVCILEGSAVPFVLRRWQDMTRLLPGGLFSRKPFDYDRPYCYVGQAVVNDIMYNSSEQIDQHVSSGDIALKEIWLR